jgi:hypothetical protein
VFLAGEYPNAIFVAAQEPDLEEQLLRDLSGAPLSQAVRMSQSMSEEDQAASIPPLTSARVRALRQVIDKQLTIDSPEVRESITQAAPWLAANPREMKRFVNVFRFLVMIDSERGFQGMANLGDLNAIAKVAVLHILWPDLIGILGKPRAALDGRTVYELLEGRDAIGDLKRDLQRCRLTGKMADRITATELRKLVRSHPKIGDLARNYL